MPIATTTPSGDLSVRLTPRARRNAIIGEQDGAIRISVTAPPVDDKANKALCKLIAKSAGVANSHVTIVKGKKSRDKVVRVDGLTAEEVRRRLSL